MILYHTKSYILNYIILLHCLQLLLFNVSTLWISKLVVKSRIQILVLIATSLRRYKSFHDLWHEIINVKT